MEVEKDEEEVSLRKYLESLKNFNFSNPQYRWIAYLQFYDDGYGGVKYIDFFNDPYPTNLLTLSELIENYK